MDRDPKHWWVDDIGERLRFEGQARREFAGLAARRSRKPSRFTYSLPVDVPVYDHQRKVRVTFAPDRSRHEPVLSADGLASAKHRYNGSTGPLCAWFPRDRDELRWVFEDGLGALIDRVRIHLFQEEYFRRHGQWPGPEAEHPPRAGFPC